MMPAPATLILADDHPIVRKGFAHIISSDAGFRILAEAGEGHEALRLIEALQPDIAVLDIAMPGANGLEIARKVKLAGWDTQLVLLTMYRDREYFDEAVDLGILGYILKDSAVADLLACLRAVRGGDHYISPTLSSYLIDRTMPGSETGTADSLALLTPSEREVLRHIADQKTSREIADSLYVSYRTVQNHRANMCRKLNLKGHHKLLLFALEHQSKLSPRK